MSDQHESTRAGQRARYSTGRLVGTSRPLSAPRGKSSRARLTANQWTALVCVGVVLFIGMALAFGVVVGRALRGPLMVRAVTTVPARPLGVVEARSLATRSDDRVDPRPSTAARDSAVSLLLGYGPSSGDESPDFELEALDGDTLSLNDLRGQTVVVNFWATWCTWCKYELPALQTVYDKYRNRGLVVIGVNVEEPQSLAAAYAERYGLTFPVVLDEVGETAETYGVRGLPMTFFIDRDGVIDRVQRGAMREDELELYVRSVLPMD